MSKNNFRLFQLRWRNIIEYIIENERDSMKLCRICLNNKTDLVEMDSSIDFTKINRITIDFGSIVVKTMLNAVLPKIDFEEEYLPQNICYDCLEKTVNAYIFIKQYEKSNMMMKECVDKLLKSTTRMQNNYSKPFKILCKYSSIDNILPDGSESSHDSSTSDIQIKNIVCNRLEKKLYSSKNKTTTMYECTMCSLDYSDAKKIQEHLLTHSSHTTHICRECGSKFNKIIDFKVHMRGHRIIRKKNKIICHKCGKIFTSELNLKRHSVCHEQCIIRCDVCNKKFKTKSLLRKHILNNHEKKTNAICEICGKVFTNIASVKSHMNCHKTRKCPYCNKTLKTHVSYDYHIKKHETGIGRKNISRTIYKCNDCNYKSCNKNTLEGHINKMHLNIRPYICTYVKCEKRFYTKGNLQEHTRFVHINVKTEKCSQCGATFVNQKCLKRHMRLHIAVRPYMCDLCKKTFVSTGRRNEHMKRTHSNSEQFCTYCDQKFTFKAALNRHVKEIHT